jgi:hypothetical protein
VPGLIPGITFKGGGPAVDGEFTHGVAVCSVCGAITRFKVPGYDVDGREKHDQWHLELAGQITAAQ